MEKNDENENTLNTRFLGFGNLSIQSKTTYSLP